MGPQVAAAGHHKGHPAVPTVMVTRILKPVLVVVGLQGMHPTMYLGNAQAQACLSDPCQLLQESSQQNLDQHLLVKIHLPTARYQ